MKKKLVFIFLVVIVILSISVINYAKSPEVDSKADIEISIEGADTIKEGDTTYTLTLKLGNFNDVEENKVLGFETIVEYDDNLFTDISVTEKNDWNVTYSEESKKLIGFVDECKANTEIAELTFTIKDNVTVGTTGNIALNQFIITDDQEIDKEIENIEKNGISVVSASKELLEEESTNTTKTPSTSTYSQSATAGKQDNTTANLVLPKAGQFWITGIIIIVAIVGIIYYIKLKVLKMKLKGKL